MWLTTPRDQAVLILALDTLARASDIVRLTWADDHGGYLTLRDPKMGTPYAVTVSRRLRALLDQLPRDALGLMFPHRQSTNGRPMELCRMLRAACLRAGVTAGRAAGGVTFHSLRHTGTTRMVAAGIDLRTVQDQGGWRSMRQLSTYAHPTHTHRQAAVDAIGDGVAWSVPEPNSVPPCVTDRRDIEGSQGDAADVGPPELGGGSRANPQNVPIADEKP